MRKTTSLLLSVAAIGGLIYLFDPAKGQERRRTLAATLRRLRSGGMPRIEGSPALHALASSSHLDVNTVTDIRAPLHQVFSFFTHPENYLWLSDMVTDVSNHGDGSFAKDMLIHGVKVHFEERFTQVEDGVLIETQSLPPSAIKYSKSMWFEQSAPGHTRVHLAFTYQPPAGVLGHQVAETLGIDPKTILEELMMAAKRHLQQKHADRNRELDEADQPIDANDESTFQPRAMETDADDYQAEGPIERVMSPDEIDQAFTSDRDRAMSDQRDLLGDSMAAQTDEDGQNFVEEIATAVTESPAPEEMEAADVDPPSLEPDPNNAIPRPKPR